MTLTSFISPADNLTIVFVMCAISILFIALGIFFYVPTNIVPVSVEGATQTIEIVLKKPFPKIKVCFDVAVVSSALILSYLFLGNFGSVGIGTVLSALLIGSTVKLIHRVYLC